MKTSKVLRCFLSIILIGGIGLLSIPSFAYTVDGVELTEITLTYQDYANMFADGGFTVFYELSSPTSVDISLFDMYQNATSQVVNITSTPTRYPLTEININNNSLVFSNRYAYNMRVNANASLLTQVVLDLPFNYYLSNASFTNSIFMSGTSTTSYEFGIYLKSSTETIVSSISNSTPSVQFWSANSFINKWVIDHNISTFPSGYTLDNSSTGIRTKTAFKSFANISTDVPIDQIIFNISGGSTHTSGTGYDYSFIAPMLAACYLPLTVYVMPDIADTVEEYLDLITGPATPTQQARINELKDKFDDTLDDLDGAKENIHKDMPDLPSVSDLPEEAIDGMEDASEYVINPFLSIGIVSTLLGVTFIFTVIKILLYGSGPY